MEAGKVTTDPRPIQRIHVVKYIVMVVCIFLVFPLLVYWVASPGIVVNTEYMCVDANSPAKLPTAAVGELELVAYRNTIGANQCKQIVPVHATLTGLRHSPGLGNIFDRFKSTDVAPSPMFTPYINDDGTAAICDILSGGAFEDNSESSPARRTCLNHKKIRAASVAVFVLTTIAGILAFWMCRVTEGELLAQMKKEQGFDLNDIFSKLEQYKGWRGVVGMIWGCLLAGAVIWQVQVYDKLYSGPTGKAGYTVVDTIDYGSPTTNPVQWADTYATGSVGFGAGLAKTLQIYLWALFSLFTAKVYFNRRSVRLNLVTSQGHAGVDIGGGVVFGLNKHPGQMDGVAVELAPTAISGSTPQLIMDPEKLSTHNALMRKSLS